MKKSLFAITEIENVQFDSSCKGYPNAIQPGYDRVFSIMVEDMASANFMSGITIKGIPDNLRKIVLLKHVLANQGISEISSIKLLPFSDFDGEFASLFGIDQSPPVTFSLATPFDLPEPNTMSQDNIHWKMIFENDDCTVRIGRILIGENGLVLCFNLVNHSDLAIPIILSDPMINGLSATSTSNHLNLSFVVGAGANKTVCIGINRSGDSLGETEVRSLSFVLSIDGQVFPATVELRSTALFGIDGGVTVESDSFNVISGM